MPADAVVVATGDVHVDHGRHGWINPETGRSAAWEDTARTWLETCQWAADHQVDLFTAGGDMFLSGRPSAEGMALIADGFHILSAAGVPVVLLLGNHELIGVKSQHRHALLRFGDINGVTVVDRPELVRVGGVQVACLPWPRKGDLVSEMDLADMDPKAQDEVIASLLSEAIDEMADEVDPAAPALILGHAAVGEATIGNAEMRGSELSLRSVFHEPVLPLDALDRDPFGHVVLSHIHQRQFLSERCHYVGSPDRIDFSEEREKKGFSVLRASGNTWDVELEPTTARLMKTFRLDKGDTFDAGVLEPGTLVRVFLPEGETRMDPAIRADVADAGCRLAKVVTRPKVVQRTEGAGVAGSLEGLSPVDGVRLWAERNGYDSDGADRLVKKAEEVVLVDAPF